MLSYGSRGQKAAFVTYPMLLIPAAKPPQSTGSRGPQSTVSRYLETIL
jgi:hypothetical protein